MCCYDDYKYDLNKEALRDRRKQKKTDVLDTARKWNNNSSGSACMINYEFERIFDAYVDYKKQFNFN